MAHGQRERGARLHVLRMADGSVFEALNSEPSFAEHSGADQGAIVPPIEMPGLPAGTYPYRFGGDQDLMATPSSRGKAVVVVLRPHPRRDPTVGAVVVD